MRAGLRRWRTIAALFAGLLALSGCVTKVVHEGARGAVTEKTTTTSAAPPPEKSAQATKEVLAGEGSLVLLFRTIASPLLEMEPHADAAARAETCSRVADQLGSTVDPTALFGAASSIPDPVLSEIALSARQAVGSLLPQCIGGDVDATDRGLVALQMVDAAFSRRLAQL